MTQALVTSVALVDVGALAHVGTLDPARAAQVYARAGFQPIPLYGLAEGVCRCQRGKDCDAPGKHPRMRGWQLAATSKPEAVAAHGWGAAHVGLAMGGEARLVALDIDGEAGRCSLAELEHGHGALPATLTLETGRADGGQHRIFRCPDDLDLADVKNRVSSLGPGLDVRAGGGQIVVPPSGHVSGRRYRWATLVAPAPLPDWLYSQMTGTPAKSRARALQAVEQARQAPADATKATSVDRTRAWADAALASCCRGVREAAEGQRNHALNLQAFSAGQLVAGGALSEATATAELTSAARAAGLDEQEIIKTLRSAFDGARSSPRSAPPERPLAQRPAPKPTTPREPREPGERAPLERGDHVELADRLVEELAGSGPLVCTDGDLWTYGTVAGRWAPVDVATSARIVASYAGAEVLGARKPKSISHGDVGGAVGLAKQLHHAAGWFDAAPTGIAFKNGFVRLTTAGLELTPHASDNRARHGYEWAYDQGHGCAAWSQFLYDLFREDHDCAEKIDFLQEFVGAALLGIGPRFGVAAVLVGDGANGKSTLLEVLQGIMPPGSTCAIAPQIWGQEYRRAEFVGRRLNAVSELPEADILESEAFKAIITGDLIDARRIREAPFSFRPCASHMFAANRLPGTNDQTDGFWRRFVVLGFNRAFRGSDAVANLASGLLEHERAGIVQWALQGAHALQARGRLPRVPSSDAAKIEWRRNSDPVAVFVDEVCEKADEPRSWIRAMPLYRYYVAWCSENGHRQMSSMKFGMRLAGVGVNKEHRENGCFYALRLRYEAAQ